MRRQDWEGSELQKAMMNMCNDGDPRFPFPYTEEPKKKINWILIISFIFGALLGWLLYEQM